MLELFAALALALQSQECPDPAPPCDPAIARSATIEEIMARPDEHMGKCVSIRAISNGYLLFTSIEGYYLAGPLVGGDPDENPRDRERLGLDNREVLKGIRFDGLRYVTAIGRVQDCETVRNAVYASAGDEIVFISGFCHHADGPYLWLKEAKVGESISAVRLVGEAAREKVGNLVPAPVDWRYRTYVDQLAAQYLDALRRRDKAKFRELHLRSEQPIHSEDPAKLAFGRHAGFAALRRASATPQMEIFIDRDVPLTGDATVLEGSNIDEYASVVCFCPRGDCTDRWPISRIDADNREDRPYVCTEVGPFTVFRRGEFPAFSTEVQDRGLPEPKSGD